jgi:type I restriction enzyme S subunit
MASVKDLTPFGVNLETSRKISEQDYEILVHQGCKPEVGDILIAKDGASALDTVCEIRQPLEVVLLSSVAILRPDPRKLNSTFLKFYLDCSTTRTYLKNSFVTGAAIPRVVLKDFKKIKLRVPNLAIQQKIAEILSAYDDLIENNTRRIQILEEMARRIYEEWFVRFRFPGHENVKMVESEHGLIPEGWEAKRLGEIAQEMRRTVNPSQIDPSTPYVGLEHIPRRSIALMDWGEAKDVQSTKHIFKPGNILFGKIRPYFHKVSVAPLDGVCSSDAIVIEAKDKKSFPFVLGTVSSDGFVQHATQTSNGVKMPRANWGVLVDYPVFVPTNGLIKRFSDFIEPTLAQIANFTFKVRNLRRTRDLLLPKLISGEIDVSSFPEPEAT